MSPLLVLLVLIAPLSLVMAGLHGLSEPGIRPRRVLLSSRVATLFSLAAAILAAVSVAVFGPATSALIGFGDIGLSVRLDALSVTLFALVSLVGAVVVGFSRNYLDGDPRQGAFIGGLCLTLAAVGLLVLSGNLVVLVVAWIATGLALQRLLLFRGERPGARVAARKKAIVSRAGEACLIAAAALLAAAFGTTDIAAIAAAAAAGPSDLPSWTPAAALLIALAALLKSAQFPTHGWLVEVMETPTPVSALLHAGIINAGGFLIVRFADVMLLSSGSMLLLAVLGGFTALFGSMVMLTQSSVKVSLAWSTVAQMGFMLMQCGLGAFSAAVLHLVAHSLYKAHAFLAAGGAVEVGRLVGASKGLPRVGMGGAVVGMLVALVIFVGVGTAMGVSVDTKPAIVALGAILVMGLSLLLVRGMGGQTRGLLIGRAIIAVFGLSALYFALQIGASSVLADVLPAPVAPDGLDIAVMVLAVVSFGALTLLQLPVKVAAEDASWRAAAHVTITNGFYVNAVFNRLVGAFTRTPSPSTATSKS